MNRVTSLVSFFEHFTVLSVVRTRCQSKTTARMVGFSFIPIVSSVGYEGCYTIFGTGQGQDIPPPVQTRAEQLCNWTTPYLCSISFHYPLHTSTTFWEIDVSALLL